MIIPLVPPPGSKEIAAAEAALLAVDGLDVRLASRCIVRQVSLRIQAGEIFGLVGASGSGKSMTALAILRLLPERAQATGSVRLAGQALHELSEVQMQSVRGRSIGMIFQEPRSALNPLQSIGAQVAETLRVHRNVRRGQALRAARLALDRVGLSGARGALHRRPFELSGGERQRVAIAMAVIMEPAVLIADEPTTALDVVTQAQILRVLQDLARSRGMGILLVTHDLKVVAQICDRVAVLQAGSIVEQGETAELLRHAQHDYTRALLDAAKLVRRRAAPTAADDALLLEVSSVVQEYSPASLSRGTRPVRALDGVSLSVHGGEIVGVVGESGSGKSTLVRVILALQRPQRGEVRLRGEDFMRARGRDERRLRRFVQCVFQDPYGSFDPRWRVERLIAEPCFLLDSPPSARQLRQRVADVLAQVGLEAGAAAHLPHEFSGGERQRIAIARALITAPALILFDEALSALDALTRAQILDLLGDLAHRLQIAYLFVSHDVELVAGIADRVYVMQGGRVVERGVAADVLAAPAHPYTRALIDATPRLPIIP